MMRFFIYLSLILMCLQPLQADNVTNKKNVKTDANLNGHVIDKNTGEHIPFFTIMLKGTTIGTATDETGHYFLKNLPIGTYTIRAHGIGFRSEEKTITLIQGKNHELNFEVEEDIVQLETVVISANKNETSRMETGHRKCNNSEII